MMERFTHLGRPIDLRYRSNMFAVVASGAVGALGYLVSDETSIARLGAGAIFAVAAFLSWALGRELDPDRTVTANIACVAGGLVAVVGGSVSIGSLYLALATSRVIIRTTGLAPKTTDLVAHLAIAAVVAQTPSGWLAGMAFSFAVVADVRLPDPAPRSQLWWASATAVGVSLVAGLSGAVGAWTMPVTDQWTIVGVGLMSALLLLPPEQPSAKGDLSGTPLSAIRLRWGRSLTVAYLVGTVLVAGGFGIAETSSVWMTLIAAGVVRGLRR